MECFVYVLYSRSDDKFYVGVSNDVEERLERHKAGKEDYTRKYTPRELIGFTKKPNKSSAFKLETKL
ncbi:MAG: GIY-YIG nuclease family protein [Psychroflexus sp.]|nr:GIY-YIG nuclease family protein [Psychroflexus sp.]